MTRVHGLAIAIALAFAPTVGFAQDAPDPAYDESASATGYDGGENIDAAGRRIDSGDKGDAGYDGERYDDERYDDRYADARHDDRYADARHDDRYADARHDDRYDDERYADARYAEERDLRHGRRYDGNCNRKPDRASPVLGFLLGGLIGNQFGHGSGRAAATAVGAHLGHSIARDAANNCEDRYRGGRGYSGGLGFGYGVHGGGHRSGWSLSFGNGPRRYGFGYPGEYWRYRYHANPWRW